MPLVYAPRFSIISFFLRKNRPEENNIQAVFIPCNERTSKAQGLKKQTPALHHSGASVFDCGCEALGFLLGISRVFFECQIPAELQSEVAIQIPLNKDVGPLKGLFKAQVRS